MSRPEAALIDELEFSSYVHNRKMFPEVSPERWALIFSNVPEMEERYLDMSSTGNILDRHGDDRFADNIQRALEGLPQNGDVEEEEAAAEEGAAIEASGYMDPVYERNGR